MRVLNRPKDHTVLFSLVLLSIPIAILNAWVILKGNPFKVFQADRVLALALQAICAITVWVLLLKAKRRALLGFFVLACAMLGTNLFFLISTKNYALAFYALFILILTAVYAPHLFRALFEAYYHSGQKWYEGRPRFLPKVQADVVSGAGSSSVRISRLAPEGCYVFFGQPVQSYKELNRISIKLDELTLDCAVELVSESKFGENTEGVGLRFLVDSRDQQKDIQDFIDRVRSSGYVR